MGAAPSYEDVDDDSIRGGQNGWPLLCAPSTLRLNLSDKTYVVTGANTGIGYEVVKQLTKQGARVIMVCRNQEKAQSAIDLLKKEVNNNIKVEFVKGDFSSLASVRECGNYINEKYTHLDGLVNNAGIMMVPKGKTVDGFETQIGVNHFGPFLLTELLLPLLKKSANEEKNDPNRTGWNTRIINTSSVAHAPWQFCPDPHIDMNDINFDNREYKPSPAYSQSKLANVLHARALGMIFDDEKIKITAASVHPGWVATSLAKNVMPLFIQNSVMPWFTKSVISPEQGAHSTLHALLYPDIVQGGFYSQTGNYNDASKVNGAWPMISSNKYVYDDELVKKFYEFSLKQVNTQKSKL